MFKFLYILEVKGQEDRVYRLECQPGSPRGECYDALQEMSRILIKEMEQAAAEKKDEEKCDEYVEKGVEDAESKV